MSHLAQRIGVFLMAATGVFAQSTPTPAPVPDSRTSGMVGIALGQTARFNVLNPASSSSATAPTCSAVLTYYDATGATLKTSTVSVAPGTAGYLDLFSDVDLALPAGQRKQIRATFLSLDVPATSTSTVSGCRLIGNLEIFNTATGATQVVIGAMRRVEPKATPTVAARP